MNAPLGVSNLRSGANNKHDTNMHIAESQIKDVPAPVNLSAKDIARFWGKVDKGGPTMLHMESPCWLWVACKGVDGYGQFSIKRKPFKAHRVSWMIENGPIPFGICVCHKCDNPACIRVDHIFLGTHADNAADRESKGRGNQPRGDAHGFRLHPGSVAHGEANGRAKLTAKQVGEIRASDATKKELAAQFGVTQQLVGGILRRKGWKHI